jgi:ketosteroid isomerase-like protein
MSAEQNKQRAKEGYEAFARGDADGAMENMDDSIEWVVGGDNALTGTHTGKEAVGQVWAQVGEKGFRSEPKEFLAEGDKVVVLRTNTIRNEEAFHRAFPG